MEIVFYENAKSLWRHFNTEVPTSPFPLDKALYKKMLDLFQIGEYYFFIFNFSKIEFEYISPEIFNVLGYEQGTVTALQILEAIHPDDRTYFLQFEYDYGRFIASLPKDKMDKYKLSYDFRIRHKNGHYKRILHQTMIVHHQDNTFLQSICVHTDISFLKKHNIPEFSIIGYDGEPTYHFKDFYPSLSSSTPKQLTQREHEILDHMLLARTSKEIAAQLCISEQTVKTHRKKILAKTGCKSIRTLMLKYKSLAK